MKKKWLIGFASAAMVVTLCFGFAACGGGKNDDPKVSDADIVADMKDTLDLMYADESPLTPVSYTVTHSVKLNGKDYTVDWSVEAVTEGITLSDFVEVGAVDEAKNTVTIEIKKTTQVVDYTIEGTFTVGEETGSVSYDRQIPQIYDVAGVKALVNGFSNQQYYKVDDEVVEVVVKGYVVSTGEWASKYNNFQKVYIADTPTETNKSNECQVYGLILDNVYLTKQEDLVEGAEIIVAGALQYYSGPEITFYNDKNIKPRALYYKLPDLSDEDIVDRALAKLSIPSMFIKEGTYTLPTELEDATITWAVTAGSEYASVSGGTLTLSNLPTDPADVTLTATVTKGNSHKDKPFTVKVYKSNITHAGTQADPYTPAEADELAHTLAEGTYYEVDGAAVDVYVKGKVVSCTWAGDTYGNFNYVYLIEESAYTADVTKDSDGVFMVYRIKKNAQLPNENSLAKGDTIVVKGNLQNFNGTYQLGHKDDTTSSSELIEYKSSMTATEKVAAAVAEAKAAIPATLTADFNLPTSRFADVTLTFTSDKQDVIKVEGGKLTVTRPTDADATVTITVKATCGTDEKSETVSVTVPKQLVIPQDAVTATVTIATYADAHSWTNDKSYATVDIDTNITATMSGTKVGQYALNTGKYNEKSETWRIYQNENPTLKFEAKNGATILTIKITYTIGNTGILTSADKKVNYESDEVIEVGATEFSFSVGQTGTVTNGRVDISAIEVVYSGGTEIGPADKLAAAVNALTLNPTTFTAVDQTVTLPTTGLNGTTVAWTVTEATAQYFNYDEATHTLTVKALPASGEDDATVTITASVSIDGVNDPTTKTFTLTIKAPIEEVYTPLESATAGDYILALYQGTLKKWLFATGVINSSNFGETSESIAAAATFTLTASGDGWTIQLKSNNKYLELNSNHRLYYVDSSTQVWKWNEQYKVFTFDVSSTTYYIGSYGTFNTISASTMNFLEQGNFAAKFGTPKGEIDNQQRADAVAAGITFETTDFYADTADVDLPTTTELATQFSAKLAWTVDAETYLKVEGNKLTLVSNPDGEAVTVTLTCTVTVGEGAAAKTATKTFTIQVHPANAERPKGTADNPYKVSELTDILASITNNGDYYKVGDTVTAIYIEGIITKVGEPDGNYGIKNYYIGATATYTDNDIQLKANWGDVAKDTQFEVGGTIVVEAYLEKYNDKYQIYQWYDGSAAHYPLLKSYTPKQLTDEDRRAAIDAELAKVTGISITEIKDENLPTSGDENVTFSWALKAENNFPDGIQLATDKITVTALPADQTTVTLILTATYKDSEVSNAKEVIVTISAAHATDEEKAAAALKSLDYSAFKNAVYSEVNAEGVQLPQTSATVTEYGATVTWSVEGEPNEYVSISANKLCINQLPTDADKTISLTVTVSVNGTNATDTITITVKKEVVLYDITATYDPSKRGHSGNTDQTDKLKDITIALSNKSGTKSSWDYPPAVRVYTSGTIAISVPENYYFTKITLHYSVTESNPVTANVGTLGSLTSGKADWTGTENAVTFTVGGTKGRMDLTSIEFAYKSPTAECTHETVTKTDAIPAECEKPGQEAYWTCTNCNRMFSSETEKTDANEIFVPVATKALNHQFTEWTDKGDGTHHTSTCDLCRTATQEGVHDSDGEGNTCSKCGASVSADLKETVLATFNLGTNGTDSKHNDGSNATTYTETSADSKYTLSISKGVQFYKNAHDAKNNSALKLGSSKNAGSFEFTVPSNVTKVIFYVANYKKNTDAKISINGGDAIALTKGETTYCSDNGEYLAIEVDTSTTKTIKFESGAAGDKRCMIDKIEFMGVDTAAAAAVANAQLDAPVADLPRKD